LKTLDLILKNQNFSYIAIANKEMLIAGSSLLIKKIKQSQNYFIPLDSEHFSLLNSNLKNDEFEISLDNKKNLSEEIDKLNNLLKDGVLTQEEFEKAKKKLLDN